MKVLHLNTWLGKGGAAIAAQRLHYGLEQAGVDSRMAAQFSAQGDETVILPRGRLAKAGALGRDVLSGIPRQLYRHARPGMWSINWMPHRIERLIHAEQIDIVHLHWVTGGFVPVPALRRMARPLVWTLHDMWPFTGGCHYAGDCCGYLSSCGRCPQLGSESARDLSRFSNWRKRRGYRNLDLVAVAPSRWMAECARSSSLFGEFDIKVIPNGIDLAVYRPVPQAQARSLLGLPDGPLILFAAAGGLGSPLKGGVSLLQSLRQLHAGGLEFTLVIMGGTSGIQMPVEDFPVCSLGVIRDDLCKALVYAAADVLVHSAEQDNLPNTIVESLACGTPVVAYKVGGVPDMIEHGVNGLLVASEQEHGLSDALADCLVTRHQGAMRAAARRKAESEYDLVAISRRYRELYRACLDG